MLRIRPGRFILVPLLLWLTGCHSFRQIQISEAPEYGTVRVTLADGGQTEIREPRVAADSILGDGAVGFPTDSVAMLEAKTTNVLATVGVVAGVTLGALLAVAAIVCAADDSTGPGSC